MSFNSSIHNNVHCRLSDSKLLFNVIYYILEEQELLIEMRIQEALLFAVLIFCVQAAEDVYDYTEPGSLFWGLSITMAVIVVLVLILAVGLDFLKTKYFDIWKNI